MVSFAGMHVFFYRLTGGSVGGRFAGAPVLLLTTIGRKTGKSRTTPLLYHKPGDGRSIVVASNGGRPNDPSWWSNLKKRPEAEIQVGKDRLKLSARQASDEEKARLWPLLVMMYHRYDDYQRKTGGHIPVVILQ